MPLSLPINWRPRPISPPLRWRPRPITPSPSRVFSQRPRPRRPPLWQRPRPFPPPPRRRLRPFHCLSTGVLAPFPASPLEATPHHPRTSSAGDHAPDTPRPSGGGHAPPRAQPEATRPVSVCQQAPPQPSNPAPLAVLKGASPRALKGGAGGDRGRPGRWGPPHRAPPRRWTPSVSCVPPQRGRGGGGGRQGALIQPVTWQWGWGGHHSRPPALRPLFA